MLGLKVRVALTSGNDRQNVVSLRTQLSTVCAA